MKKVLQIVSFDVPYPANYGGAIDVFYKLKALHKLGISIVLHTFEYGRGEQKELDKYCDEIFYYKRNTALTSLFSLKPFIVKTRDKEILNQRIISIGGNVLFEGLHTIAPLSNKKIQSLNTLVRTHNIEHQYYLGLAKSEKNIFKKVFFLAESLKLKQYQNRLQQANKILTISPDEQDYFKALFGDKVAYLPVFSEMHTLELKKPEKIVLWHGDLRVSDNKKAVLFAIDTFKKSSYKLCIASSVKSKKVKKACKKYKNIEWHDLSKNNNLKDLFSVAQINLLLTYQATGIKLKLINALTQGRFVLVNDLMVKNTGIEKLCTVANTKKQIITAVQEMMNLEFSETLIEQRKERLLQFDTSQNAKVIKEMLL